MVVLINNKGKLKKKKNLLLLFDFWEEQKDIKVHTIPSNPH